MVAEEEDDVVLFIFDGDAKWREERRRCWKATLSDG